MSNTPEEWENEDIEQQYSDEYEEDESEFEEDSDGDVEDSEEFEEEYEEEDDDDIEDDEEEHEDNAVKRKLIVGGFTILILFILIGGSLFGMKLMKKSAADNMANISNIEEAQNLNAEENNLEKQETVVDDNGEELTVIDIENEEAPEAEEAKKPLVPTDESEKVAEKTDTSSLEIEDAPKPVKMSQDDGLVDIAIGDVGRKNPFLPITSGSKSATSGDTSAGFEVIEPPSLAPERSDIAKLLSTKVTGILYDNKRPSAIINIDGIDQLVRIGDVLSGFYILDITKNKVIIQSDSNIYKASVGQPLNAERVVNSTEISNLQSKFYGSTHQ